MMRIQDVLSLYLKKTTPTYILFFSPSPKKPPPEKKRKKKKEKEKANPKKFKKEFLSDPFLRQHS